AHARVAAILIHLIRRGPGVGRAAGARGQAQCGFQYQRVRGAHRVNSGRGAGLVTLNDIQQGIHAGTAPTCSSGSMASSVAAMKARATPAKVTLLGMTPSTSMDTMAVIKGAPALASGATTMALP